MSALGQFVNNDYVEYDTDVDEISEEEFSRRRRAFDWKDAGANAPTSVLNRVEINGKVWTIRII